MMIYLSVTYTGTRTSSEKSDVPDNPFWELKIVRSGLDQRPGCPGAMTRTVPDKPGRDLCNDFYHIGNLGGQIKQCFVIHFFAKNMTRT